MVKVEVMNKDINVMVIDQQDYISLTDMARLKDTRRTEYVIQNWMRNRNTIEFMGIWEVLNNPGFKHIEFDVFRTKAGLNSFVLTAKQWIEKTGAIGIVSKPDRYGGTYAHKDIAFEFGSGVRNLFKYTTIYLKGANPQLIDGDIFKIIIPYTVQASEQAVIRHSEIAKADSEGANEGAIEGAIEGAVENISPELREKLGSFLRIILNNEGKRVPQYKKLTNLSQGTVERYLMMLRRANLIEFIGTAPHKGGYYPTAALTKMLGR